MEWDWDFVWQIMPTLLEGFKITLLATILGAAVAMIVGLGLAIARRSPVAGGSVAHPRLTAPTTCTLSPATTSWRATCDSVTRSGPSHNSRASTPRSSTASSSA
jgi:ABC-type amino acid transport system permease subunit